ncbi:hypothetical protein FE784_00230 [Paenibacillus hemerocallicola]|uniref:YmaF family protein n=1 Tax=Paenibacillus hemerocallicola TaxID=1172614 RepID=A0A5C4TI77_9BACL|nr:YmaF family protein [Paenibacillus hemerocallicola]TNJ68129.1 hypothetical protein FE784_00230 [Paenibacillus hemerocallicola]
MLSPKPIDRYGSPSHAHYARVVSSMQLGHLHKIDFFTYPVNGSGSDGHFHDYQGVTRVASYDGQVHFHRFYGITGPAIALPDGSHYHRFSGNVDDEPFSFEGGSYKTVLTIPRHMHFYSGVTGSGLGYEPSGW